MFAPREESILAVSEWLQTAGIVPDEIASRKGWLAVDLPASQVEQLFKAKYYEHESADGMTRIGCDRYCSHQKGFPI